MLNYPHIDPIIVRVGPLAVRWYGVMYLLGFLGAFFVIRHLAPRRGLDMGREGVSDLLFYAVLGVILGGRLGYVVFYNLPYFLHHWEKIPAVWEGGMSFHGGLLGLTLAVFFFCWKRNFSFVRMADVVVASAPIGLGLGRIGNFINAELWGRTTSVPWGMIFPGAGPDPRHPSQLYEAALEGPVLFLILWLLNRRNTPPGLPFFAFFFCYGLFRIFVEFFRQPDAHLGFLWGGATMGQLLSLPMVFIGVAGMLYILRGVFR